MTRRLRSLWPRSLAGQLVASLLAVLVVAQMIAFAIVSDERRTAVERTMRDQAVARTVDIARLVAETPSELHGRILRNASDRRFRFDLTDRSLLEREGEDDRDWSLERRIAGELGPIARDVRVTYDDEGFARWFRPNREMRRMAETMPPSQIHQPPFLRNFIGLTISIEMAGGRWLNLRTLVRTQPPSYEGFAVVLMVVTAAVLVFVVIFTVRRMTRPLRVVTGSFMYSPACSSKFELA